MPAFIDQSQLTQVSVTDATGETVECVVMPLCIPLSEVAAELAEFDPESGSHPLAAQAKPLARPALEALILAGYGA